MPCDFIKAHPNDLITSLIRKLSLFSLINILSGTDSITSTFIHTVLLRRMDLKDVQDTHTDTAVTVPNGSNQNLKSGKEPAKSKDRGEKICRSSPKKNLVMAS